MLKTVYFTPKPKPKPAQSAAGEPAPTPMRASNWSAFASGQLVGLFNLHVYGLVINRCSLHRNEEREWIGLPGRPLLRDGEVMRIDGKVAYEPAVLIECPKLRARLRREALIAVHRLLEEVAAEAAAPPPSTRDSLVNA
jgi:hypothetical protein